MRWKAPMEIMPLGPGFAAELRGVTIHDIGAEQFSAAIHLD
jgi:hypothetical protein